MTVNISNIQHFSTGDGEGIRTTVFFKGCNLRCPWCHNPENLSAAPNTLTYRALGKTELLGKREEVSAILPELTEDRDFYLESGGGVTFSGGEVMLQPEGAAQLAQALKAEGIPVLIDTAGCVPYTAFEMLNPLVSGYLFDLKTADAAKYRSIGGELSQVTENIQRLKQDGMQVELRIPLIPGFNTENADIRALSVLIRRLGMDGATLLPFHRLGSAKYEAMGLDYAYREVLPLSRRELDRIAAEFEKEITVTIEK